MGILARNGIKEKLIKYCSFIKFLKLAQNFIEKTFPTIFSTKMLKELRKCSFSLKFLFTVFSRGLTYPDMFPHFLQNDRNQ